MFSEVKEQTMSDGTHYHYYVPGNSDSGSSSGSDSSSSSSDSSSSAGSGDSTSQGGGGSESEEIAKAEALARESEAALEVALQKYKESKKAVSKIQKALGKSDLTEESKTEYEKELKEKEAVRDADYAEVSKKADAMIDAYTKLGAVYEKYHQVGDPVEVSNGQFIAEYVDFTAEDYLSKFMVSRSLTSEKSSESFGALWNSSLDSRIVRCNFEPVEDLILMLENAESLINDFMLSYEDYQQRGLRLDMFYAQINQNDIAGLSENSNGCKTLYDFLLERQNLYTQLKEKNTYVAYGRFASPESYLGGEENLIYLDEKGREYYFKYEKDGIWKSFGPISSGDFYIQGMMEDGSLSSDLNTDGGYLVSFVEGNKKIYSKYGILEKEIDQNGNETIYKNQNGLINQIVLKTGEILTLGRDGKGRITEIKGDVSGKTSYTYQNDYLVAVVNNDGIPVSYSYDSNGLLRKILKADDSFIDISYDFNSYLGTYVCSSVTNEKNESEYFSYDFENGKTVHTGTDGKIDLSLFDKNGGVFYVKDGRGSEVSFEKDENGLISVFSEDGVKRYFLYDSLLRPVEVLDDDGVSQHLSYNERNQLVSIIDGDGFALSYEYDDKGNLISEYFENTLISSASYTSEGLVKSLWKDGVTWDYEYNSYGSILKEKKSFPTYGSFSKSYEYDDKNRLVRFSDWNGRFTEILYDSSLNKRTEIFDGREKIERFFDAKNREKRTVSTDLLSGQVCEREVFYDGHGNVIKILLNGEVYEEFSYNSDDSLLSVITWNLTNQDGEKSVLAKQGQKTTYVSNEKGLLQQVKTSVVNAESETEGGGSKVFSVREGQVLLSEFSYNHQGKGTVLTGRNMAGCTFENEYDKYGRLVKEVSPDGYTRILIYSKGGRLKTERDSRNNVTNYYYRDDGSFYAQTQKNGLVLTRDFDCYGRLVALRDYSGSIFENIYDENGQIILEKGPGYETASTYDVWGRKLSSKTYDLNGKLCNSYSISYDKDSLSVYHGDELFQKVSFDMWNRPVEFLDKNGKTLYSYDALSNPVRIVYGNGNESRSEYNCTGKAAFSESKSGDRISLFCDSSGSSHVSYLGDKRIFSNFRNLNEKSVETHDSYGAKRKSFLDENGRVISFEDDKSGVYQLSYDDNSYKRIDENGNEYLYEFDDMGRLVRELDCLGNQMMYFYDELDRLVRKVDFEGQQVTYKYDGEKNKTIIEYNSGETVEVQTDPLGRLLTLKSSDCDYKYDYNEFGQLIHFQDSKSQLDIDYFYDGFGRCIEKKSDIFDLVYSYDGGKISRIDERKKNVWVAFKYDLNGNEIERSFSTGNTIKSVFDSYGNLKSRQSRDSIGQVIFSEEIERDSEGRIISVRDKNGNFTKFDYDTKGRLVFASCPYTESIRDFYLKEAENCGMYVKNLPDTLLSWDMAFEYTSGGNIAAVESPLGKIFYEYDAMNRLICKHGENSKGGGMTFTWDKNGNLREVNGASTSMSFDYQFMNRPSKIVSRNLLDSSYETFTYAYDPLGRRIREEINGDFLRAFVYDGVGLDLLEIVPLMQNSSALTNYLPEQVSVQTESMDIRWIDDSKYLASESVKSMSVKTDSEQWVLSGNESAETRPCSVISVGGLPCMYLYSDFGLDDTSKVEVLLPDYRDNLAAVCDLTSGLIYQNCFDVWGNGISVGKDSSYSYSQSKIDTDIMFLNLGFRDYCPEMKSFISQDPVRDGENWTAFCAGDPLNYFDGNGLQIGEVKQFYLMTDYKKDMIYLGNCEENLNPEAQTYVHLSGCYITTFANISASINYREQRYVVDPKYSDPLAINDDKSLFGYQSACLDKNKAMNEVFGEGNWDYWTAENSTSQVLKAQMVKYQALKGRYYLIGVFDLSSVVDKADNHMVALNDVFNDEGFFDSKSDVVGSSVNDNLRVNGGHLNAYSLDNLKELRVVGLKTADCTF